MSDAISRSRVLDGLIKAKSKVYKDQSVCAKIIDEMLDIFADAINKEPALDVAPVVHAHWIKTFGSDGFVSTLRCSKCENAENSTYIPGNFCWFCGAKMDGETE